MPGSLRRARSEPGGPAPRSNHVFMFKGRRRMLSLGRENLTPSSSSSASLSLLCEPFWNPLTDTPETCHQLPGHLFEQPRGHIKSTLTVTSRKPCNLPVLGFLPCTAGIIIKGETSSTDSSTEDDAKDRSPTRSGGTILSTAAAGGRHCACKEGGLVALPTLALAPRHPSRWRQPSGLTTVRKAKRIQVPSTHHPR